MLDFDLIILAPSISAWPRNPDFPDRQDLWRYKAFAGLVVKNKNKFTSAAEMQNEANIAEEDFMNIACLT